MVYINQEQLDVLRDLAAGDSSFLIGVIDVFLPQLETVPAALRAELAAGADPGQIAEKAHSLKGSASNVGAEALAEYCRQIEDTARQGHLDGVPELLAGLDEIVAETRRFFEAERAALM